MLFNRIYPDDIFRLVMGFNRWTLRVAAYASLMTDDYPPFIALRLRRQENETTQIPTVARHYP